MKDFLHAGQSNPDSFRHTIFVGDIEKTYWEVLRKQYLASRTEYDGASQIKLHHVGSITADKAMHQYYTAANIIVLNSKCEAFGRVIVEAFAHGVVVLAKGCGGPAEIIRHGKTGLLFSTGTRLSLILKNNSHDFCLVIWLLINNNITCIKIAALYR